MTQTPSKTSLYHLGLVAQTTAQEIARAAELLSSDDPDELEAGRLILEEYLAAEEQTQDAIRRKADGVCHAVRMLTAQADFRKAESKRLAELAKGDELQAQRLTDYMVKILTTLYPGETKFSLPHHELTSRQSARVEVDEALLPKEFFSTRIIEETKPNKDSIKAALKAGASIAGAALVTLRNWKIG